MCEHFTLIFVRDTTNVLSMRKTEIYMEYGYKELVQHPTITKF